MDLKTLGMIALAVSQAGAAAAQSGQNVPLYRVTVIERTVKAVNYEYRGDPTAIDFRGTVLMPEATGGADVQSKAGRTDIDARFDHVTPPTRYGREYLTYVLWAITPEGRAKNLGEVMPGSSDKAKLRVTTDLQAFGLIVTAEPYAAVRQPSDVVVMENEIRPDTIGTIKPIQVKYDLMPRGEYTYNKPPDIAAVESGPSVSMGRYEEILEVYQAQNAVQIAGAMGAAQYADDTFARAQQLLRTAQTILDEGRDASDSDRNRAIATAREAAQTAEDARAITMKRKQEADVAAAQAEADRERQLRARAEADAQSAQSRASADRAMLDQERNARQQAEAQLAAAQSAPPAPAAAPAPPAVIVMKVPAQDDSLRQKRDLRMNIYQQLASLQLDTTDTPRGIVVTIPAGDFTGGVLRSDAAVQVSQVAALIAAHPGLYVEVDDNFDGASTARAESAGMALRQNGVPAAEISVHSIGNARPIASTTTIAGRELNRRVEIVISGAEIGSMPYWDKSYSLVPR